jgi:integrase
MQPDKRLGDRPGAAKTLLKRLRSVCRFALERGLIRQDPTQGVSVAKRRSDGFRAWTDADIEKFEAKWPSGSRARLALCLLLYTGQRRGDAVRIGRQHVRDGVLHVRQQKTRTELAIPLHPTLKAELDRLPTNNLTFPMTAAGKPFSAVGFSNWFTDCARKAGLPDNSSPHGLRNAARWLAEAGCSALEIAAITGHASLKEVERYTKSAAQHRLAEAAIGSLVAAKAR